MLKSQGYCMFFMLALFEGFHSVKGNISKRACLGESIKIFDNISFNSKDIVVSIYKNGDNTIILGMWHVQDAVPSIKNGQSDRVLLDKNGNIWILNLHVSDEAKYTIKIDIGKNSTKYEVPLYVMAPPTKNCKPNIIRAGNSLSVHLKADECGRPAASAYWLEHPGIPIARQVIQLQPGKDNGIYHSCIEGESLICAKISNFSDYCSFYNESDSESLIGQNVADDSSPRNLLDNIPSASSGSSTTTIFICLMVALCLILLLVPYIKKIHTLYQSRNKKSVSATSFDTRVNDGSKPIKLSVTRTGTLNNDLNETELDNISVGVTRTGTLNNDLNETELDNISVGDASERLIPQSVSESSNPKKSCGASDSLTPQSVAGSSNPKRSLDPSLPEEERREPVGKHPVQGASDILIPQSVAGSSNHWNSPGTILKSTGTNRKNITPLLSGNHDKENEGQQQHVS